MTNDQEDLVVGHWSLGFGHSSSPLGPRGDVAGRLPGALRIADRFRRRFFHFAIDELEC